MSVTDASTTQRTRSPAHSARTAPALVTDPLTPDDSLPATTPPTVGAHAPADVASSRARRVPSSASPAVSYGYVPSDDCEAAARRTLRGQVAKLESDLASLVSRARACDGIEWSVPAPPPAGPRLLDLGELEHLRDDLADRLHDVREILAARATREVERRTLLERMLRDPAEHRFLRITRADVGEPGCGAWESRPRLGLIGMLAGWWHIKISSGCPLSLAVHQL